MKQASKTSVKRFPIIVLLTVAAVLMVVFCVSYCVCYQAVQSESHTRYVGIMNLASEKIAKTVSGMEMNAMNEFDEVRNHPSLGLCSRYNCRLADLSKIQITIITQLSLKQ